MKKHKVTQVQNELKQSGFFAKREPEIQENVQPETAKVKPKPAEAKKSSTHNEGVDLDRQLKRFSHDLYIDQMETLSTKVRGYFLVKGEHKSNAQMVREAVDEYIKRYS